MRQGTKLPLNLFSAGHLLLGMQPILKSVSSVTLSGRKLNFICKWLSVESTRGLGMGMCPLPVSSRTPSSVDPAGSLQAASVSLSSYPHAVYFNQSCSCQIFPHHPPPVWGHLLECSWPSWNYTWTLKLTLPPPEAIHCLHRSSRGGGLWTSPHCDWMLTPFILYRLCVGNHDSCEFVSLTAPSCSEDSILQQSSLTSDSYSLSTPLFHSSLCTLGRKWDTDILFVAEMPHLLSVLTSVGRPVILIFLLVYFEILFWWM